MLDVFFAISLKKPKLFIDAILNLDTDNIEVHLKEFIIPISVILIFFLSASQASEENDLWLLLSSYEDIGITTNDLAFFLVTHGYNAKPAPDQSYVVVTLKEGGEVYLTVNGASERLADMWMTPPQEKAGPVQVIPSDAVRINASYNRSEDSEFIKTISRYIIFPVTPLGMCYDGAQKLEKTYSSFGYNVTFLFDPAGFDYQGHIWVAVEDGSRVGDWLAVDSYYGIMDDPEYYSAPYSFSEFQYLDAINPRLKI